MYTSSEWCVGAKGTLLGFSSPSLQVGHCVYIDTVFPLGRLLAISWYQRSENPFARRNGRFCRKSTTTPDHRAPTIHFFPNTDTHILTPTSLPHPSDPIKSRKRSLKPTNPVHTPYTLHHPDDSRPPLHRITHPSIHPPDPRPFPHHFPRLNTWTT